MQRTDYIKLLRAIVALGMCIIASSLSGFQSGPTEMRRDARAQVAQNSYVGSQECALCHPDIYEKYSKTDMGRSMSPASASLLGLPASASLFDQHLNRHFELSSRKASSTQTEFEIAADGHEVFRDTQTVEWTIGAGANGVGAIVRRSDYLFEAPLSYYSQLHQWALSPGYEYADYAFSRPILPGCVSCHSGRPQALSDGNGRFRNPPFLELAIGCENCHGPGEAHIAAASAETIINPAKLSGWRADNICLECHQTGDARVLHPGKDYSDFVPGDVLDQTVSVFMVPFGQGTAPKDDLLQHYLSMRLSKCYRQSKGKLTCITCHDPHQQPTATEAPAYFRQRCLTCHTEQSCTRPLAERQRLDPPDDCVGCHMPKRDVTVISHSVLTNHRIVTSAQEPFPEMAFHLTTPESPDLVYLSGPPDVRVKVDPLVRLQAYRQIIPSHPEYRERYWKLGSELETKYPNDVSVLEAVADSFAQEKNPDGIAKTILYLDRARKQGTTQAADFEQLGRLLIATQQWDRAIAVLKEGIANISFDEELYRLLTQTHFSMKNISEACKVSSTALQLFPQDDSLRKFFNNQCEAARN